MKKQATRYNLERICGRMAQKFGTIKKGEEERYHYLLFVMESNALKLHREDPKRDSRRAIEAIQITLMTIDGYLTDTEYDFGSLLTEENEPLVRGYLMAFDPFTNEEVKMTVSETWNLDQTEDLRSYYEPAVRCLTRLEKSVEMCIKEGGSDGYFQFLERAVGEAIPKNQKMEYAVFKEAE